MLQTIISVFEDILSYLWPLSNRNNLIRTGVVLIFGGVFFMFLNLSSSHSEQKEISVPFVRVGTVADVNTGDTVSFIGTVRSIREAHIQSEVGGRVTTVNVVPGDTVSVGTTIATLENASERASTLQAQGVYEAALATAAQSEVSVTEAENGVLVAKNNAVSVIRSTYTQLQNTVYNSFDQFFSNSESGTLGVKISGTSYSAMLHVARTNLRNELPQWTLVTQTLSTEQELTEILENAKSDTKELIEITNIFISAFNDGNTGGYSDEELATFSSTFTTLLSTLNNTLVLLEKAEVTLKNSNDTLQRVKLGATSGEISSANAQVKQALGSLRAAQANLAKTILRTPITGVVNNVQINTGDFITSFTPIAEIAGAGGLEISIFVGETDSHRLVVGDTVSMGMVDGIITNIAPAIDPLTLKTEVKIGTESSKLTNGDTVSVTLSDRTKTRTVDTPLLVPITAIKFTATDGVIFTLKDGVLVSNPVTIGPIQGSLVTINEGITQDTVFVLDARGFSSGQKVEASFNTN